MFAASIWRKLKHDDRRARRKKRGRSAIVVAFSTEAPAREGATANHRSVCRGFCMKRALAYGILLHCLLAAPVLAVAQESLLTLARPQWGATREEITESYGPPAAASGEFLVYRPRLTYGPTEIRLRLTEEGLRRIVIGVPPREETVDLIVHDVTQLLGAPPRPDRSSGETSYVWTTPDTRATLTLFAADGNTTRWHTLQFTYQTPPE
jgi:hypothetical protein